MEVLITVAISMGCIFIATLLLMASILSETLE